MIFYTTVAEMENLAKEFGLYMEKIDNSFYKIYCKIPDQFDSHIFVGADRTIGGKLEICEFYTNGYYVWNEDIKFLDDISNSRNTSDHHWTYWVKPIILTIPKRRLKHAKDLCDNFSLVCKKQLIEHKLEDLQKDFQ